MLSKDKRLNVSKNYKFVTAGKRFETAHLIVFYRSGENDHPLVGIALNKRYFRKATSRNRAKRLANICVEAVYDRLPKDLNLVIMPKETILKADFEILSQELKNARFLSKTD